MLRATFAVALQTFAPEDAAINQRPDAEFLINKTLRLFDMLDTAPGPAWFV